MSKLNWSLSYGLLTVLIWSTVATAFKLALAGLDPFQLVLLACCSAFLTLLLVVILQGKATALRGITKKDLKQSLLLGFFNPVLYYILLFKGYETLPAQIAQPVNYTWVITLTLLSVPVLGRRLSPRDVLGMLTGYAGLIVTASGGQWIWPEHSQAAGLIYILAGTILWAGYWLVNVKRHLDPMISLELNLACAIPWALAAALFFSKIPWSRASAQSIIAAIYVGAFEMGLAFITWLMALKLSASTAKLGSLVYLAPLLSMFWIALILGEEIARSSIIGLIMIVIGGLLQSVGSKKTEKHKIEIDCQNNGKKP